MSRSDIIVVFVGLIALNLALIAQAVGLSRLRKEVTELQAKVTRLAERVP